MGTFLHGESRRMYSWWWDSHISPKNSKWLQENLMDMDRNVKAMIKLIEEDADSFARRAEMYYKKRPELLKLVEEFYRAYRALAERYDHATGALRQAHQTMAEAFPNQIPSILPDESPSTSSGTEIGPHTPEMTSLMHALLDPDDLHKDALGISSYFHAISRYGAYSEENDALSSKKGLKQLNELFPTGEGAARAKFSEGKVRKGFIFQEEEGKVKEKEDLKNEIKRLQEEVSQLSTGNENLKSQMASESERAQNLEDTLSKLESEKEVALLQYKLSIERISSLETEISNTRGELIKVNDEMAVKLNSAEERLLVMEMVNQSLQLDLETQQKELEKRGRELEELNISIQEEHQKRMQAKVALMSMEQIHSHSQEEAELLALEIQNGAQKLKDMEMSKMGLEEECSKLKEIIGSLSEQNLSVDLKIKDLEDGMISLKESKGRLEGELGLHLEEKKTLQQELYCLKEDRNGLEQKHRGLMEQMEVVSEKNEDLENSLSDANVELEGLREKVKALEASCETLLGEVSTHVAEKGVLVSQIETISQNMEKLSEKCTLLENSLSDANDELEGLRVKFKYLEESCRSLCDQNSSLLAEKNTLVSQVENLESRYLELQDKNSNLEREKDSTVHQVMELESSLRLQKQEYEALILSSKSQLSALQNQIHLLQEEFQVKEEEFEVEQQKAMNSLLQIFILQGCLCDMKDKNLILSGECQNILEASRCAEKLISQLEHKDLIQKKELTLLSEHNGNLREGILLLLKTLNINKECGTMDGTKDEVLLQIIFVEIKNLLSSISDAQDENRRLHLEVLVLVTLLKQTALDKSHLYRELECQTEESLALVSKKHELMEMNEQLKAEKNTLISQMEIIRQSLVNLETKYLELEDKHSSLERERDSKLHQVMELESSIRQEKKEHEALILSSKSQLSSLENQIHVLQAERQVKEEEFEMEQQKATNALLEIFMLQRCLYDMKDQNLILSGECQKLLGASRCLEKLISQLEHKDLIQKKERSLLSEHNEKLREGILLLLKELNINKECGTIDGTKDEALLHTILGEIKNLLNSISDAQDENQCLHLEVLVLVTLLKEFGFDKFHLYRELESRTEEAFALESNKHELVEMNERLKAGKTTLISEVEIITQSLEILETKYLELEEKHSNLERERDSALRQVMELESSLRLEKQEHEAMFLSSKSQLAALENQIHLLLEERQVKEGEFEVYQQKAMNALLEIFILQRCLYDMQDKNLILSAECQKLLDASRSSEKLMFQLQHEDLLQKKEMTLLSGRNEKLREGILLLLKELNINKECGTIDVTKDEALLQTILGDIKILLNSISDTQDENQCLHLGKSVLVTLLKQIGLEKVHFYHELESHAEEALALQSKKDEVMEMNKHLKAEMKVLCEQLSDLHGAHQRSQTEICNLLEENWSLSKKIYDLREKKGALEEENSEILAEAMTLDHLYIFFRCLSAERAIELKLLSDDIYFLLAVKNDIDKDIRVQNERMRKLEAETMNLKDSVLLLEFDLNTAQNFCEEFDLQNKTGEYLLIQKEMELSKAQDKNEELCRKLEGVNKDLDGAEVVREELEKKMLTLSEDNASKDMEITCVREANGLLCKELDRLSCEVEVLRRREEYLTSELQKGINDIYQCEGEIGTLLNDIQTSTVNAAVFEEKVFELIVACESLEIYAMLQREMLTEKIVLRDACVDELKKKLDDLEGENRAVKADMNAYLPHLIALWDGIASVEEHTLSLARLQQIKDDDSLVSHQNKKNSHQQSEDDCSTEKTGLLQLQKLITKVEALRKVIIDTEALLEQERLDSNANLEAARKEIEELKLKEISLQEISKDYGQKMKDIQLDQVSSTCIASYRPNKIENSEPSDQMLELWETAERDDIEAVEEEKSEYPSSKLVAEKEPSVDKLEVLTKVNDSPQECNKRVIERLASDAQRLSVLQRSLQELKTKLEISEKNKYPKSIEYNTFKVQLREVEEAILEQVDINGNLRKKAEDNFESSNGVIGENERRQISEWSRRGSEKIGKLELEIQKIEYIFLKLEEEENKRSGYGDRKSSILLRDYLYGRRDGKGRRKGSFCGCLRPKTMG